MNILVHVYATISYSVGNLAIVVMLPFWGSFVVACVTFFVGGNDTSKLVRPLEF